MRMVSAVSSSFKASVSAAAFMGSSSSSDLPHWDLYPKSYTVSKLSHNISATPNPKDHPSPSFPIDGNIEKAIWRDVPWSDVFGDIQGPHDGPANVSIPVTRFKALYDDAYLYIAAVLYPAEGLPTRAQFTERNAPIYQKDSDFEVFVDVDHSQHQYKELEVNAINTIWNLLLDKPYDDGGVEHSGRIARPGDPNFYEVYQQATATQVTAGRLNNPDNRTGATWTVEIALSFADLLSNTTLADEIGKYSPAGRFWRINFSRVEERGVINWTWQPQVRWDPIHRRYAGFVQMHLPDAWGYLYFAPDKRISGGTFPSEQQPTEKDPLWPAKLTAMTVYYALHEYKRVHGNFTNVLSELSLPMEIIAPFRITIQLHSRTSGKGEGFVVIVSTGLSLESNDNKMQVHVQDDRLMKIICTNPTFLVSTK